MSNEEKILYLQWEKENRSITTRSICMCTILYTFAIIIAAGTCYIQAVCAEVFLWKQLIATLIVITGLGLLAEKYRHLVHDVTAFSMLFPRMKGINGYITSITLLDDTKIILNEKWLIVPSDDILFVRVKHRIVYVPKERINTDGKEDAVDVECDET